MPFLLQKIWDKFGLSHFNNKPFIILSKMQSPPYNFSVKAFKTSYVMI
jgi:hypothetical protein